jgi:hypothetical protein
MPHDLHHSDVLGWSEARAEHPRRMRRGELVDDLDRERVIEGLEDAGGGQPRTVTSHLGLAMPHSMVAPAGSDHPAAEHPATGDRHAPRERAGRAPAWHAAARRSGRHLRAL